MSLSPSGLCLSCESAGTPVLLLPHLASVAVVRVERVNGLRISVSARGSEAKCSRCGAVSSRVHSRYERRLDDAPVGGQPVMIRLAVRRFFCLSGRCQARTFAEQIEGLTSAYARRTPVLRRMLEEIALALAGRFGICVGRSSPHPQGLNAAHCRRARFWERDGSEGSCQVRSDVVYDGDRRPLTCADACKPTCRTPAPCSERSPRPAHLLELRYRLRDNRGARARISAYLGGALTYAGARLTAGGDTVRSALQAGGHGFESP